MTRTFFSLALAATICQAQAQATPSIGDTSRQTLVKRDNIKARATQARTVFSIGPRVGLNMATAKYADNDTGYPTHFSTAAVPRLEAGLQANICRQHVALQASLLYSQKGFQLNGGYERPYKDQIDFAIFHETYFLNYLTLPVSIAYTQKSNSQGFQGFAGGYASILLGGRVKYDNVLGVVGISRNIYKFESSIRAGRYNKYKDDSYYSQRYDAGLQAGAGYRYGHALMQVSYSVGLANLGARFIVNNIPLRRPSYYSRTLQASLSYLVGAAKPSGH